MFPLSLEVRLIAWAVAAAAALGGFAWFVHRERAIGAEAVTSAVQAVGAAQAASTAITEAKWQATTQETVHVAQARLAAASAAAGVAARERDALLVQLDRLRAGAVPGDPAAAGRGQDLEGGDPIGVLAGLLDRADARAGVVSRLADERRIRAEACERWADALTAAP